MENYTIHPATANFLREKSTETFSVTFKISGNVSETSQKVTWQHLFPEKQENAPPAPDSRFYNFIRIMTGKFLFL
jgi:hypothetical protein